jgi:hypothetical protein
MPTSPRHGGLPRRAKSCQAAVMTSPKRSVLPPSLTAKLSALGSRTDRDAMDATLKEIMIELSALPAGAVVRAAGEIAAAARLWWQPAAHQWWWGLAGAPKVDPDLKLLTKSPDYAWLFLFHHNGHVREAALGAIDTPPTSPFLFSALAWRLNDWALPVRSAARRCADRVLPQTSADVAAEAALYLLDRRLVWGRWRDEPKSLDAVFSQPDVIGSLASRIEERSTGPVARCLRHALRFPGIDAHLYRLATAARQPLVRAIAHECLSAGKASWVVGLEWMWIDKVYFKRRQVPKFETREIQRPLPLAELIKGAAGDKSAIVRKVAADALIAFRSEVPNAEDLISELAKDRSPAVRSRADFLLRHPVSRQR